MHLFLFEVNQRKKLVFKVIITFGQSSRFCESLWRTPPNLWGYWEDLKGSDPLFCFFVDTIWYNPSYHTIHLSWLCLDMLGLNLRCTPGREWETLPHGPGSADGGHPSILVPGRWNNQCSLAIAKRCDTFSERCEWCEMVWAPCWMCAWTVAWTMTFWYLLGGGRVTLEHKF